MEFDKDKVTNKVIETKNMSTQEMRLRFGELTNDEILLVRAIINYLLSG